MIDGICFWTVILSVCFFLFLGLCIVNEEKFWLIPALMSLVLVLILCNDKYRTYIEEDAQNITERKASSTADRDDLEESVILLHNNGESIKEISDSLDLTVKEVTEILLDDTENVSDHDDTADSVMLLYDNGYSIKDIADSLDLTIKEVTEILIDNDAM